METQLESRTKVMALGYTFVIVLLLFLLFILIVFSTSVPSIKVIPELTIGSIDYGSLTFESNVINRSAMIAEKNKSETKESASNSITSNIDESIVIKQNQLTDQVVFSEKENVSTELQNALNKANQKNKGNNTIGTDVRASVGVKQGLEDTTFEQEYVKGRRLLKSPSRIINATEEGVVVVSIIVDETGKVVNAIPGQRGTTVTNAILFEKARVAAYEAKFNPSPDGTKEQIGTYTFVFTLE